MKKSLLILGLLMVCVVSGYADTVYNNYTGFNPFWQPFGNPDTATYGETFTAPSGSDTNLASFSFWMAGPVNPGDIVMGAYIATWTGTHAGTLLYSSQMTTDPNTGEQNFLFTPPPNSVILTAGGSYVMFLSVSQYYGQSTGLGQVDAGDASIPGGNFVYYNNEGNFNELFTNGWDAQGIKPDWAVTLDFNSGSGVPEPGTLMMLGTGLLGGIGVLRRKLF